MKNIIVAAFKNEGINTELEDFIDVKFSRFSDNPHIAVYKGLVYDGNSANYCVTDIFFNLLDGTADFAGVTEFEGSFVKAQAVYDKW